MGDESVFLTYVRVVLKRWTGLQLAIMDGMGGIYAKEKETWFGTQIEEFFRHNANLFPDEVTDFIAAILDQEFDTIAEDGSVDEISEDLCKAYELCKSGKQQEVAKMISEKTVIPSATTASERQITTTEETTLTPQIETLKVTDEGTEASADGWTEVKRGKRHK